MRRDEAPDSVFMKLINWVYRLGAKIRGLECDRRNSGARIRVQKDHIPLKSGSGPSGIVWLRCSEFEGNIKILTQKKDFQTGLVP